MRLITWFLYERWVFRKTLRDLPISYLTMDFMMALQRNNVAGCAKSMVIYKDMVKIIANKIIS